jgi:hypothetical protein
VFICTVNLNRAYHNLARNNFGCYKGQGLHVAHISPEFLGSHYHPASLAMLVYLNRNLQESDLSLRSDTEGDRFGTLWVSWLRPGSAFVTSGGKDLF